MKKQVAIQFLKAFSMLTVGEDKRPNFPWKTCQTERMHVDKFEQQITYNGGIKRKDGSEIPATKAIGIVTGFEDLEVIDVDLKVFSTPVEMKAFWNEFLESLRDNIYDFDKKFAIYKTKSGGYHILYKSKRVTGNKKIAKLEGHTEAVIESRGVGGYVFVYPNNCVNGVTYFDINYITDEDRRTLWNICSSYNYEDPTPEKVQPKTKKHYTEKNGKTPWDDFNEQHTALDVVVPDDFVIPPRGNKSRHTLVKRHGAKSPHSGYVFKNNGCMYLFSTGTDYPHEKLLSPFACYAHKYHKGDMTAAARDLYEQGFGDRLTKEIKANTPQVNDTQIKVENTEFPVEVFPKEITYYINSLAENLQMNVDYMGCSYLWLCSVIVGNSFEVEIKTGWRERAILWISLVGPAGIGKTPSINKIITPLERLNNREIKNYLEKKKEYDQFKQLDKKERKELFGENYHIEEPQKTQFLVNDITLEALVQMHQQSDNALGVHKDELAGWLKDMNKYRAGSDLEFWLSSWAFKPVSLNRKTSDSNFVDKPFIPVLGGIQPSIFNSLSTEENKQNGFLDRILLAFPDMKVEHYTEAEMSSQVMQWYNDYVQKFYTTIRNRVNRQDGEIIPEALRFSDEAKQEWIRIFNDITDEQNSDHESEYLKSMYPKQKSYIPRFALLIRVAELFHEGFEGQMIITKDAILKAEKLSKYFVNQAKKVKLDTNERKDMREVMREPKTNAEKIMALYEANPKFNRTKASEMLEVSRRYVIKVVNSLKEKESDQ